MTLEHGCPVVFILQSNIACLSQIAVCMDWRTRVKPQNMLQDSKEIRLFMTEINVEDMAIHMYKLESEADAVIKFPKHVQGL